MTMSDMSLNTVCRQRDYKPVKFYTAKVTCPDGWGEHFSGYCYLPIGEEQTWADAQSFCKDNNTAANLVTIVSDYENDFVRGMASGIANQVWIGLSDRFSEGDWVWVDGTTAPFRQWNPGNVGLC